MMANTTAKFRKPLTGSESCETSTQRGKMITTKRLTINKTKRTISTNLWHKRVAVITPHSRNSRCSLLRSSL